MKQCPSIGRRELIGAADPPDDATRVKVPFDIDEFVQMCSGGNLVVYLDAIKAADDAALDKFQKMVVRHKLLPQKTRFAAQRTPQGIYRFFPHDEYLLRAIWWEKTKRSKWRMFLCKRISPLRNAWMFLWRGMETLDDDYIGYRTVGRDTNYGMISYTGIRMVLIRGVGQALSYFARHHWQIIT